MGRRADLRRPTPIAADWRRRANADWRRPALAVADQIGAKRRRHRLATTLDYNAGAKHAPAPHTTFLFILLKLQTGWGFQRPTPVQV